MKLCVVGTCTIKSPCLKDDDDTVAIIHDCALALPTIYPMRVCAAVVKQSVCPSVVVVVVVHTKITRSRDLCVRVSATWYQSVGNSKKLTYLTF